MNATIRRLGIALIGTSIAAAIAIGFADSAAAKTVTGQTSGASAAYLPSAVAYASTASAGCDRGYFAGDLGQKLSGPITCIPFASDFDASATALMITEAKGTCPTGYQRGLSGDAVQIPYYTGCVPWDSDGNPTNRGTYQTGSDQTCAPGYSRDYDATMPKVEICWIGSAVSPTPSMCAGAPAYATDGSYIPCVFDANGRSVLARTAPVKTTPAPPVSHPKPVVKALHFSRGAYVTGKAKIKATLVGHVGRANVGGTHVTYRWISKGRVVGKSAHLKVSKSLRHKRVYLRVTVSHSGYRTATLTSKSLRIR